jgi:hypothetical protein
MHSTPQLQGIDSLHGTLFTYRKITATLHHTKGLRIDVSTGGVQVDPDAPNSLRLIVWRTLNLDGHKQKR